MEGTTMMTEDMAVHCLEIAPAIRDEYRAEMIAAGEHETACAADVNTAYRAYRRMCMSTFDIHALENLKADHDAKVSTLKVARATTQRAHDSYSMYVDDISEATDVLASR